MNTPRYSVLACRWLTSSNAFIGAVAIETDMHEEDETKRTWKAYIGICHGLNRERDMQQIAAWGAPLLEREARGFFPDMTRKYKES